MPARGDMRLALIAGGAAIILTAPAQSAEATIITLACHGKFTTVSATSDAKPKPVPVSKMGLVVNVPERSVAGFEGLVAHIDKSDASHIWFSGRDVLTPGANDTTIFVGGDIDRVTGAVHIYATTNGETTKTRELTSYNYDLLCKPTRRLF
jgi:hypothetical protein